MQRGRNARRRRRRQSLLCAVAVLLTAVLWRGCHTAVPEAVYLKQTETGTCTLVAATMLLRETARRQEQAWRAITVETVREAAWCEAGLYWTFSYGDYTVRRTTLPRQGRKAMLKALLAAYPQGVVAYNSSQPHGVWLITYDTEAACFYAADPSRLAPEGAIPLTDTVLHGGDAEEKLAGVDVYWYVE